MGHVVKLGTFRRKAPAWGASQPHLRLITTVSSNPISLQLLGMEFVGDPDVIPDIATLARIVSVHLSSS